MELTIDDPRIEDPSCAGNKAATLAQLVRAGFNVPPFFVIAANDPLPGDDPELRATVAASSRSLAGPSGRLAVRSSSAEEDGHKRSFAGQFATYLGIGPADVFDRVRRVMDSGNRAHLQAYRSAVGSDGVAASPAVLVQKMIDADTAGVAFAADPVSGVTEHIIVAAVRGTGDSLVNGASQGDTWTIDRDGQILERLLAAERPVLTDDEIAAVADLVMSVSAVRGSPQDIEWACRDGELFLLQSRDITTLDNRCGDQPVTLWDNSNIVESYGGITLPLTFSVAREAYEAAYRHMGRVLGIRESVIRENHRCYEQMIGLIQGRVYYNLLNWYRLLMLTPGFRFNKGFMEQMMGVTEALPDAALPQPQDSGRFAGLRRVGDYLRISVRLSGRLIMHRRRVRAFHRQLGVWLTPVDLERLSLHDLLDEYERLQSRVIPAWETPLVNDLFCMMFHGALKSLCDAWLCDDLAGIHNDLVAGEAAIVSLEPVRRMTSMATLARPDPAFVSLLQKAPAAVLESRIENSPDFKAAYDDYLAHFGDRCLDELKLESATLRDDPTPLLRSIGQLAGLPARPLDNADRRNDAEAAIAAALRARPVRYRVIAALLKLARAFVRDRENLRFERTRVYGRVRSIFVEIGRRLTAQRAIARESDIFYLAIGEISGFIRGTGVCGDLRGLVAQRAEEFGDYRRAADLPRRFVTKGPPQSKQAFEHRPDDADGGGDVRKGQACSRGVIRGPVRIVHDPRQTDFRQGEILVAQRTDPGWVTIFPLVSGMIMERGSLLSHSAIVARELDIPAVVGVDNACQWLADGDWVELDGATGVVRRLAATEAAA